MLLQKLAAALMFVFSVPSDGLRCSTITHRSSEKLEPRHASPKRGLPCDRHHMIIPDGRRAIKGSQKE